MPVEVPFAHVLWPFGENPLVCRTRFGWGSGYLRWPYRRLIIYLIGSDRSQGAEREQGLTLQGGILARPAFGFRRWA